MKPGSARGERLRLAGLVGLSSTLLVYALHRASQHLGQEPDPASVYFVERSGYFARILLSAYVGAMAALAAHALSAERPGLVLRIAAALVPGSALALGLVALLLP